MHWLWVLYFGYIWPSLKSNGPEAVVQTFVYAGIWLSHLPAVP